MKNIIRTIIKYFCDYIICLLCVSACWVGLEYIFDGSVHSSDVDSLVAVILSGLITDKIIGGK